MTERSARALLQRFGQFADRFADGLNRQRQRAATSQYLDTLFNDSDRKSMQAMHGRLSDPGSYQVLQHLITDSSWEAEPLWARLREVVPMRTGILAVDDASFPKQGKHSVGVKHQYCGALGKIANCQVAVSTVLLDDQLAWPLSFELYLPKEWVADPPRRADTAHMSDVVGHRKAASADVAVSACADAASSADCHPPSAVPRTTPARLSSASQNANAECGAEKRICRGLLRSIPTWRWY